MTIPPSHRRWRDLVLVYEELEPEERTLADGHLEHCPSCRQLLEELRRVEQEARSIPEMPEHASQDAEEMRQAEESLRLLESAGGVTRGRKTVDDSRGRFGRLLDALVPHSRWAWAAAVLIAVVTVSLWPRPVEHVGVLTDARLIRASTTRGDDLRWRTGDAVEVELALSRPGAVVVVHVGPDGRAALLHGGRVGHDASQRIHLPPPGGIEWRLEGQPGVETFLVAATDRESFSPDELGQAMAQLPPATSRGAGVAAARALIERVVGPTRLLELEHAP